MKMPPELLSLFPQTMHAHLYRKSRLEAVSRFASLAAPGEEEEGLSPLSFESLWCFRARRERSGWKIEHQLRLVTARPSETLSHWKWLTIYQLETDFWCDNKTPTTIINGTRIPPFAREIEAAGRAWGFPDLYWRASKYGYGTVADQEHGGTMRFWDEDSAHERLERYLTGYPLIERFRALGFEVDGPLHAILGSDSSIKKSRHSE